MINEWGRTEEEQREYLALLHSPAACAVADAWIGMQRAGNSVPSRLHARDAVSPNMEKTLDALELATRDSPLRKVRQ